MRVPVQQPSREQQLDLYAHLTHALTVVAWSDYVRALAQSKICHSGARGSALYHSSCNDVSACLSQKMHHCSPTARGPDAVIMEGRERGNEVDGTRLPPQLFCIIRENRFHLCIRRKVPLRQLPQAVRRQLLAVRRRDVSWFWLAVKSSMSNASAAAAADERKSFVFQIDDASPSKEGKDAKDAENNKDQGLPLDGVTEEAKQRAIQTSYPYQLINEQDAKQLCEEFIDWPQSLPNGFAGHVRTRVKSPRSIATSRRNVRFMLGLLKLLGLDTGDFTLSLDMLAVPSVCKLLLQTLEQRKVGGQRRYQVTAFR